MSARGSYSGIDRLLHRVAFHSGVAQRALSDAEDRLYRRALTSVDLPPPVFITGLPRSGTTALLQNLHATRLFATHTYRDVPFVMTPLLWRRFSRWFPVDESPRERMHGDGLVISTDSPEAFEEMIWKHFWPDHYVSDRILPWRASDRSPEFERFIERHMRKVLLLHRERTGVAATYLSKNNLNFSRLDMPFPPFLHGHVLIPFREPTQHAASLLLQHRRFSRIHDRDDFVRVFMEGIGHFEFGRCLRPVDLDGWLKDAPTPDVLEFWLRYWTAAYRFVRDHAGSSVQLVSYARLTESPARVLGRLAEVLGVPPAPLVAKASGFHPPRRHEVDLERVPASILEEALGIYETLLGESL